MPTSYLDDAASSLSRYTNASSNVSCTQDPRSTKRRKSTGLNLRFDRMIKSANDRLSYRNRSPPLSQKRILSSGTSSVSSHDVPKTPVDAYNSIHLGYLGKNFSVLKPPLLRKDSERFPKPATPPKDPRNSLPDWLAHTFCNLEADHPLRGLLSPSRVNPNSESKTPPVELLRTSHEEEIFAFSPFDTDKQEEVPDPAYRVDSPSNIEGTFSAEHILSNSQFEAPTNDPLPFTIPGCFAPARRSIIIRGMAQKSLATRQATVHATSMMHPPSYLRLDDAIERPQNFHSFSNAIQYDDPPSDFQEHDDYNNHIPQVLAGGDDSLNVYATPGPTFVCSRSVYFDSPTEDPSLSDPLHPESYDLDLNAIDFRWRPFLRSNLQERDMNRRSVSPSSPLGYTLPNLAGDQGGWHTRIAVDQGECGVSNEELSPLAEDMETAYLGVTCAIQPSDVNMAKSSTVTNPIGPWSSMINDVLRPVSALASDVSQSPLRDHAESILLANGGQPCGDGENMYTSEALPLLRGEESRPDALEERPSTPIRQLPVTPPSTPQKARSGQLCDIPQAPVRKMSSALSWMMPLAFSKRAAAVRGDVNCRPAHVSANLHLDSHDTIESWSESG